MVRAQDPGGDPATLYKSALADFESGDYRSALPGFMALKEAQPGEPLHAYYAGRCLVELNEELDEAIEMLYGASKGQVPGDVTLYLGMAYHKDYNFSEALKYYSRFEMEATRQEVKKYRVKHLISTCRSAREITSTYNQYEVMTVTFFDLSDSTEFTQIKMKGGQLSRKPAAYYKQEEEREGLSSLMFVPSNPLRGDYIYYAGAGRTDKDGTQLFRVKKGPYRTWGDPEEIKQLNTEGDELLPYFDPIGNDLYFSSNGGRGIGGFDLYRSHFDRERDVWSEPVNMGFPINSVMDEFLLLPGSDLGMVMFFSNRQGTDSTLTVYRVHLVEPKKSTDVNDNRMLRDIANLGGVADEILAEIESMPDPGRASKDASPGAAAPEITPVTILSPEGEGPSHQAILAEALMHQAASDSIKDLASAARLKVRESDDPNDRWVWQKQIMVWEKRAADQEKMADELYASLELERTSSTHLTGARPVVEGEPGTQPDMKTTPAAATPAKVNRFEILGESPYNRNHPVPVDVAIPDGVFYRIQMGALGDAAAPDAFTGICPITAETIPERGLIKYYAGKFSIYADASDALVRVRSAGFEDAFIVSWYNGNPISTQRAKQLE
ncbi:MAG: hypothetical protein ABFS10_09090 [Bacteroidota bacterium]